MTPTQPRQAVEAAVDRLLEIIGEYAAAGRHELPEVGRRLESALRAELARPLEVAAVGDASLRDQIKNLERIKHDLQTRLFKALGTEPTLKAALQEVDHTPSGSLSRSLYSDVLDIACIHIARVKELEAEIAASRTPEVVRAEPWISIADCKPTIGQWIKAKRDTYICWQQYQPFAPDGDTFMHWQPTAPPSTATAQSQDHLADAEVEDCPMCKGVGSTGHPPLRCTFCDGSGIYKFAPLAAQPKDPAPGPVAVGTQDVIDKLNAALNNIGDFAHDRSQGPTIQDDMWEVRRMAYEGQIEFAATPGGAGGEVGAPIYTVLGYVTPFGTVIYDTPPSPDSRPVYTKNATPAAEQGDAKGPDSFHSDSGDRDRVQGSPLTSEIVKRAKLNAADMPHTVVEKLRAALASKPTAGEVK